MIPAPHRWGVSSPVGLYAALALGGTVAMRAAVRERGRDALDRLIAAHALSADLKLVTKNESDFEGYSGLRLENWIS
jgi:tRNA(fMet)-specific endonuclease VapC